MAQRREDEEGISGGRFVRSAPIRMEPGVDMPYHFGGIGAYLSGSGLTLVTVVVGNNTLKLWENGALISPLPTIPVGLTWEVHTTYNIGSDTMCTWCLTCMCNNVAAPPGIHAERAGSALAMRSGQTGWDFNCPAMPATGASLRIKFWYIADNYTAYPDQSLW